jgi:PAS domain S-box-containing protein
MRKKWLVQLVEGTADAAFAVDRVGLIKAWNGPAAELFGLNSDEALGRPCHEILRGTDQATLFCSQHCSIHHALQTNEPKANFDLKLQTTDGLDWCNITIQLVTEPETSERYAVHVIHRLNIHKLIEQLGRLAMAKPGVREPEEAAQLISSTLESRIDVRLTVRETEILRLLASGRGTNDIAEELYISPVTVNNHVQHILNKLDSHSRLEVVVRARELGLI